MSNRNIRIYPIRTSRKNWEIKLFQYHLCSENCNIRFLIDNDNPNEIIITPNPNYINNKCDKYKSIQRLYMQLSAFNSENAQIGNSGILCNPDNIVIPDNSFTIHLHYPLSRIIEINISSESIGFSLRELIKYIKSLYEFIYEEEERTATNRVYQLKKYCYSCSEKDISKYIDNYETKEGDGECPICFCEYEPNIKVSKLRCDHIFHSNCIQKWFKSSGTCPMCRNNVFDCKNCDGTGIINYEFTGVVIPLNERGINLNRNVTNGIFGIYDYDLDDLIIKSLFYDRIKKILYMNIIS